MRCRINQKENAGDEWKDGTTVIATWTYSYDAAGRISQVTNNFGESVSYAYDGEGKLTTQTNGNSTTTTYTYNQARGWPTRIDHQLSGASFARYDLTYDSGANTVGNITGVTELSGDTMAYTYDALYRLTGETRTGSNAYSKTYTYDLAGNVTQVNGSSFATYDDANKFSTITSGTKAQDTSGNLTSITGPGIASQTYTWETREKMRTQVQGSTTYTYDYDWTGKKVKRASSGGSTIWYIFDGVRVVGEIGKASPTGSQIVNTAYIWGVDGLAVERDVANSLSYYYVFGPQGETRYLKDGAGTTVNTYVYNAYGATLATTGTIYNRHRFGGRVGYFTDGPNTSPLILATNRWYNPQLRRWFSRDPIEYHGGDNLYQYVAGNPVNFLDPSGFDPMPNYPESYIQLIRGGMAAIKHKPFAQFIEYGGSICFNFGICADDEFIHTPIVTSGDPDEVDVPGICGDEFREFELGSPILGMMHNHPWERKSPQSSNQLSPEDVLQSRRNHVPIFAGTPEGKIQGFDPNVRNSEGEMGTFFEVPGEPIYDPK